MAVKIAYTGRLPECEALLRGHATVVPFGERVDLGVSALGTHIFTPAEIADCPIVNLHLAPLPEYRGRYSAAHAVAEGARSFGVTLHYVDAGIDTGPIIAEARFGIDGYTVEQVQNLARGAGIRLFAEVMPWLLSRLPLTVPAYPQDETRARYFSREQRPAA
jgi:methionyl-tRNA formyltransferase